MNWKAEIRRLAKDIQFSPRIARHPESPRLAKLIAGYAPVYMVSPIQLTPTFIPVIGGSLTMAS